MAVRAPARHFRSPHPPFRPAGDRSRGRVAVEPRDGVVCRPDHVHFFPSALTATEFGPLSAWPSAHRPAPVSLMQPARPAGWRIAPVLVLRLANYTAPIRGATRSYVDALSVGADRNRDRGLKRMAVDARAGPCLADAAAASHGLADCPGVSVAIEAHHRIAGARGDVDVPSVGTDCHRVRGLERMAIAARTGPRLADAAAASRRLRNVAGERERGSGYHQHCDYRE